MKRKVDQKRNESWERNLTAARLAAPLKRGSENAGLKPEGMAHFKKGNLNNNGDQGGNAERTLTKMYH